MSIQRKNNLTNNKLRELCVKLNIHVAVRATKQELFMRLADHYYMDRPSLLNIRKGHYVVRKTNEPKGKGHFTSAVSDQFSTAITKYILDFPNCDMYIDLGHVAYLLAIEAYKD